MQRRILLLVLLLGAFAAVLPSLIHVKNDLSFFLPRSSDPAVNRLLNNPGANLVLIGIEGDTPEALAKTSNEFTKALQSTEYFSSVRNTTPQLSSEVEQALFPYRYHLTPSVTKLTAALKASIQRLYGSEGMLAKQYLPADPTLQFLQLATLWMPANSPELLQGVWFNKDRTQALILAEEKPGLYGTAAQKQVTTAIERIFAHTRTQEMQITLAGPAIVAETTAQHIKTESVVLSLVASIVVTAFIFYLFRSFSQTLLLFLPPIAGVIGAMLITSLAYGNLHGVTIAFGSTLLGIGLDYPMHILCHGKRGEKLTGTAQRVWRLMLITLITTCFGYAAMMFSSFPGLSQLGCYAVSDLVITALVARYIYPSLIDSPPTLRWRVRVPAWAKRLVCFPLVAAIISAGYLCSTPLWDEDISHLSPIPAKQIAVDRELRAALGAADVRYLIMMEGNSVEEVLQRSEQLHSPLSQLIENGSIAGFDMAATYLPSQQLQQQRLQALPTPEAIRQASRGLPFAPNLFSPYGKQLPTIKTLPLLTPDNFPVPELKVHLQELLFQEEGRVIGLVLLHGVKKPEALGNLPNARFIDLKNLANSMASGYRDEALKWLAAGALAVIAFLGFTLRNARVIWRIISPIAQAILTTMALLVIFGYTLSLFHITALLLVVGIGLDYAVFMHAGHEDEDHQQTATAILLSSVITILVFAILAFSSIPVLRGIGITVALGTFLTFCFCTLSAWHGKKLT